MTTDLYKKGLVLGIICLFIGASIVPSTVGIEKSKGSVTLLKLYYQNNQDSSNLYEFVVVCIQFDIQGPFDDGDKIWINDLIDGERTGGQSYELDNLEDGYHLRWYCLYIDKPGVWTEEAYFNDEYLGASDSCTVINQQPGNPTKPSGSAHAVPKYFEYYSTYADDPDKDYLDPDGNLLGDYIQYMWDWGDGEVSEWSDESYRSGEICTDRHQWGEVGTYYVKVKARDQWGATSDWSEPLTINVFGPEQPSIPQIICPSEVKVLYDFSIDVCAYDKNGDQVRYFINWDDGETTDWTDFYDEGSYQTFHHIYDQEYNKAVKIKVWAEDTTGLESNEGIYEINIVYTGLEYGENKTASCSSSNYNYIYKKHDGDYGKIYADPDLYWNERAKLAVEYVYRNYDDGHWYYKFVVVLKRDVWEWDYWHQAETIYTSYSSKKCDVLYGPIAGQLGGINVTSITEPTLPIDEWSAIWLGACISLFLASNPYTIAATLGLALAESIWVASQPTSIEDKKIEWTPTTDTENLGSSEVLVDMRPSDSGGDDEWEVTFGAGVEYISSVDNIALGRNNYFCRADNKIKFYGPIPPEPDEEKLKYIGIGVYCPVDVTVYTPNNGFLISKDRCTYHGGSYEEIDLNGDGELDKYIRIPYAFYGDYSIYVRPQDGADPNDAFSIIVDDGGENITLVQDMLISEINESSPFTYIKEEPFWGVTIYGPNEGKIRKEQEYTLSSTTIYGMNVNEFFIDWGDNTTSLLQGPFESDEEVTAKHIWEKNGNYTIRVKAKDSLDQVSDWSTFEVTMPKNKAINTPFLKFLENHPRLFPLLRQLFGLQ